MNVVIWLLLLFLKAVCDVVLASHYSSDCVVLRVNKDRNVRYACSVIQSDAVSPLY